MRPQTVTLVPFTPSAVPSDVLDERTVGRADVLDRLLEAAVAATRGHDRRHTLLVAPRGGGKTHVLAVFAHRLRTDPDLAGPLALVVLDEDAADVASYADLLVAILEHLATAHEQARARELRATRMTAELERLLLDRLSGRPLVLVLENLDRLFGDFGTGGQRELRAFVETSRAVMVVASTPALFPAVSKQARPWFGSFTIERLAPWSVEEGTAFLERIARDRGDTELAELIASDVGRARLIAVDKLIGGSPRLWTILAGCLTVELLEELVPLVMATLDELVPYYQARLNELTPNERKLVVAVCRAESLGSTGGRTVSELALAAGVPVGSAPKLLSRLEDAGWVAGTKPPGTDRRSTWYELREPLLRYHLAYRREAGAPLGVIVSFLRVWFSPVERRHRLAEAVGGTLVETYLAESLRDAPRSSDSLYAAASPLELLAGAREWFVAPAGATTVVRSRAAAIVAELSALIATGHASEVVATLDRRLAALDTSDRERVAQIAQAAQSAGLATTDELDVSTLAAQQSAVAAGLDVAAAAAHSCALEDEVAIGLLAHGWRGAMGDAAGAYHRFVALARRAENLAEGQVSLQLAVEAELAYFGRSQGDPIAARHHIGRVLRERERVLGSDHADTLTSRGNLAEQTGDAGDAAAARDLYASLLPDCDRVLGPDHPDTLSRRGSFGYWLGVAGDSAAARDVFFALVHDSQRLLGPDHPDTLTRRANLAQSTGKAGDAAAARDLLARLVPDCVRVLGPDDPETLLARNDLAYWSGTDGDMAIARDLCRTLVPDSERVLGPDHPQSLASRHNLAHVTGETGDAAAARDLFAALVPDGERSLGPDHPDTLRYRAHLARWAGEAGDPVAAHDGLAALVSDSQRVLGPDHPDTLMRRGNLAFWAGAAGDVVAARDLLAALVGDCERVFGPAHSETFTRRASLACSTGLAGDASAARDQFAALVRDCEHAARGDAEILETRLFLALYTGLAGDVDAARELFALAVGEDPAPGRGDLVAMAALGLAVVQPTRATRRDALLVLSGAAGSRDVELAVAQSLDASILGSQSTHLDVTDPSDRDWEAITHVLRVGAQGPGLAVVVRSVANCEFDNGRLARRLVETAGEVDGGVVNLTASILSAADVAPWEIDDLERWLARWQDAMRGVPDAEIATAALRAIDAEAHGDPTARPSLPPELREIVPRVRLTGDNGPAEPDVHGAAHDLVGSDAPVTGTAG
jgi:AAA ATPase-like protein/tetratricopeptide repeat protein